MTIRRFVDIDAWQEARELTRKVYSCTATGGFARDFGLRDQIQRAAGSAMHNIAEGFDSGSDIEFVRFLRYAQRSCTEVQSELYVAFDQKYITEQQFQEVLEQAKGVHAKIGGFIKYLLSSSKGSPQPRTKDKVTSDQGPVDKRRPDEGRRTKD